MLLAGRFLLLLNSATWTSAGSAAFAEEARRAWAQLKRDKGGQVWMQHVRRDNLYYSLAGGLAREGKHGQREYSETVS